MLVGLIRDSCRASLIVLMVCSIKKMSLISEIIMHMIYTYNYTRLKFLLKLYLHLLLWDYKLQY